MRESCAVEGTAKVCLDREARRPGEPRKQTEAKDGGIHPHPFREGLPVPREPASLASAARMAKRRQRGVSEGRSPQRTSGDGAWAAPSLPERPATRHGQPRAALNVRRRGTGSPEPP